MAEASRQPETGCVPRTPGAQETLPGLLGHTQQGRTPRGHTCPNAPPATGLGGRHQAESGLDPAQSTSVHHHWRHSGVQTTPGRGSPDEGGDGEDDTVPRPPAGRLDQHCGSGWPSPHPPSHRAASRPQRGAGGGARSGNHRARLPAKGGDGMEATSLGTQGTGQAPGLLGPSVPVLLLDLLAFDPMLASNRRPGAQAPTPPPLIPDPCCREGVTRAPRSQGTAAPAPAPGPRDSEAGLRHGRAPTWAGRQGSSAGGPQLQA